MGRFELLHPCSQHSDQYGSWSFIKLNRSINEASMSPSSFQGDLSGSTSDMEIELWEHFHPPWPAGELPSPQDPSPWPIGPSTILESLTSSTARALQTRIVEQKRRSSCLAGRVFLGTCKCVAAAELELIPFLYRFSSSSSRNDVHPGEQENLTFVYAD